MGELFFFFKCRKAKSLFPIGLHEFFEVPQGQEKASETDAVQTVACCHSSITQLRDYMSYSIQKQPPHSGEKGEMLPHPLLARHKHNPKTWPKKIDRVAFLPYVRHSGLMASCCLQHTGAYS